MNLGRYQLLTQQATTPDGEWYAAHDTDADQSVRVLVLWKFRADQPRWQQFARRLRLLALAHHDAIAAPLELCLEYDPPYVVFADLPERSLNRTVGVDVAQDGTMRIATALCGALAAAHRVGLVHGRLRAAEIRLTNFDDPVVEFIPGWPNHADAHATVAANDPDEERSTLPGDADPAADVHALGEILTVLIAEPAELRAIVVRMQADDPVERPTAAEVLALLDRQAGANSLDATRVAMEEPPSVAPPIAVQQLGRFRLVAKLGEGGLGVVYKAIDEADGRTVAVKVMHAHLLGRPPVLRRFRKEARLLAAIDSPYVCRVVEFNEDAGRLYLALEYLEGESLGGFLRRNGPLRERVATSITAAVARGLADAHRRGIVHRDVKPDNVMLIGPWATLAADAAVLPAELSVKLCDFGLARQVEQSESLDMTQAGQAMGTPWYMPPEQATAGSDVTPASDVYALGATLFHLLTGRPPFAAPTVPALLLLHQTAPPPSPRQVRAELSEGICQVVQKAMAKEPIARHRDAADLLDDLDRLLRGEPTSVVVHPRLPDADAGQVLVYDWAWDLKANPEQLWPYVSNTERLNHAVGIPAVAYQYEPGATDPASPLKPGVAIAASFKKAGITNAWREHPFEWIEGKRMGVLREYTEGVFRWMASITELAPRAGGGTRLLHQVRVVPASVVGRMVAAVEVGFKGRRRVEGVYRRIDAYVTRERAGAPLADDPFEPPAAPSRSTQERVRAAADRLGAGGVDPATAGLLADFVLHAPDQEIARIRPIALAQRFEVPPDDLVTACMLAAHEGLLVHLWDILCPVCRIPSAIEQTLRTIKSHGACRACNLDFALDFANSVEMIFRVHPSIRSCETGTYCIGGPAHSPHVVAQVRVAPSERLDLVLELTEGTYTLRGPQLPYTAAIRVHPEAAAVRGDLDLLRGPGPELPRAFRTGTQSLRLANSHNAEIVVRIERTARREDALTAARAAAHPRFRELFPHEVLSGDQLVSVAHVTLLATRLEAAADLYRELGDPRAFALIHEHFRLIEECVRREGGAVLKTIDEGLLATFDDPAAAVTAALGLQDVLTRRMAERAVHVAVAVHRGPAMAATINGKLDYFGRTVHQTLALAQRAAGDAVLLTQPLAADTAVQALLHSRRLTCEVLAPSDPGDALPYRVAPSVGQDADPVRGNGQDRHPVLPTPRQPVHGIT